VPNVDVLRLSVLELEAATLYTVRGQRTDRHMRATLNSLPTGGV